MVAVSPLAARAEPPRAQHPVVGVPGCEPLEQRLATLAHSGGALRRALARLAGAFVARRGWSGLGFARAGDYARERLGLSARELRELAWVDGRLAGLPAVERALVRDELPWSKVRLLCRVAAAADEKTWIARARTLPCGALARAVRAAGADAPPPDADPQDGEPAEVVSIPCSPVVRAKWWRACELARREEGARLSAGGCAEVIAAEVLSALPPGPGPVAAAEPDGGSGSPAATPAGSCWRSVPRRPSQGPPVATLPRARAGAERGMAAIAALTRGLPQLTAAQLDARLRRALTLDQRRLAQTAALLSRVKFEGVFRDLGFRTFAAYALERLGLSPARVRTLLRLAGAMGLSGAFRRACEGGEIRLGQALALVPLVWEDASFPFRTRWIARARGVTVRRLEDDVAFALAHGRLDPRALPTLPASPFAPEGTRICAAAPAPVHVRFGVEASVTRLFRSALDGVGRRLGAGTPPGEALEAMLDYVLGHWTSEAPRREHRVFARDGWRCTAPGCTSYRNLHGHHIRFRSQGGGNELANQITLCAWHHLRGVHGGRLEVRGRAPLEVRYRTGLGEWKAGDRLVQGVVG